MEASNKAIGILGGTFDPIHFGHLRMAIELYEAFKLQRVHIMPCYQPMHRKAPAASAEERLAMVECAVQAENSLYADGREIKRKGPTYTIDTLIEMKNEFPTTPLCLFVGMDAFLGFNTWHRFSEILSHAHVIIAHRPQYHLPSSGVITELITTHLQTEPSFIHHNQAGGILLQAITSLEISASDIRQQISTGLNPRFLLPDSVYDYIKQHHTYSGTQIT